MTERALLNIYCQNNNYLMVADMTNAG